MTPPHKVAQSLNLLSLVSAIAELMQFCGRTTPYFSTSVGSLNPYTLIDPLQYP